MSALVAVVAICGDALFWCWTLCRNVVNGVMDFAGFPEHQDEEETTVPTWLGATVWFIAVGGLLATVIWLAIHQN